MSPMSSEPAPEVPFWQRKRLDEMTRDEWESLCDGCARCCLEKLEDADTGAVSYTNVACRLLDLDRCRCKDYARRQRYVPDCVPLSPGNIAELEWMPSTCAYRLLTEGRDLPWWHPLVSGETETVVQAGISIRGRAIPEKVAGVLEDHVVTWPA